MSTGYTYTTEELEQYLAAAKKVEIQTGALTVRDCMRAWGYRSSAATHYAIQAMVSAGLLRKYPHGKYFIYRTK